MVVGLGGYTTTTFDAATQANFVEAIAVLGGFETARVNVISVTNNDPVLDTTVGRVAMGCELTAIGEEAPQVIGRIEETYYYFRVVLTFQI
jgi:hypothetical protein